MDFTGTYDHTLDAKNRMTVPARYRGDFGSVVILAKGVDTCVAMWRPEAYAAYVAEVVDGLNRAAPDGRRLRRYFSANAFETQIDAAGRVMLPQKLLDAVKLGKDVVVVGAGDNVEIWDRDEWARHDAELDGAIDDLTAALEARA